MRISNIVLVVSTIVTACASTHTLRPAAGGRIGKADADGLAFLADPAAWTTNPYDLPEYLTPILVQITNTTNKDVAINLADFSLIDENGFRYAAINPFGIGPKKTEKPQSAAHAAYFPGFYTDGLQANFSGGGAVVFAAARARSTHAIREAGPQQTPWRYPGPREVYPADNFPRPRGIRPAMASGFYVYPSIGLNLGWYAMWPYDFYYPPDYWTHVYPWAYPYYPRDPTKEILQAALPEGVLKGGGHVSGFVYFQNAASRANELELSWEAHTPADEDLATLSIAFKVTR